MEAMAQLGDLGGFGKSFIELAILFKIEILGKEEK